MLKPGLKKGFFRFLELFDFLPMATFISLYKIKAEWSTCFLISGLLGMFFMFSHLFFLKKRFRGGSESHGFSKPWFKRPYVLSETLVSLETYQGFWHTMCMKSLIHDRTVVYNIGYHIVWSVKYRRNILKNRIAESLRKILVEICMDKGFILKELEIMPDHLHIFVSAKPKFSATYIYKMLKGISSRKLFLKHPGIRNKLWGKHLWNPSTYVETIGHISEEAVVKYIENQKKKW